MDWTPYGITRSRRRVQINWPRLGWIAFYAAVYVLVILALARFL